MKTDTVAAGEIRGVSNNEEPEKFFLPVELLLGFLLGLTGLWLMEEGLNGPGMLVWLLMLTGSAFWLQLQADKSNVPVFLLWAGLACLALALQSLWSTPVLIPLLWLVMVACAVQFLLYAADWRYAACGVFCQIRGLFALMGYCVIAAGRVLARVELPALRGNPAVASALKGILITLPLLFIFAGLFAQADFRFSHILSNIPNPMTPEGLFRFFRVLLFTWVSAGLLTIFSLSPKKREEFQPRPLLGETETAIILASLCVLFAFFVWLQMGYLFGGREALAELNITVAQYARRGFFELLWVAGLTLALLGILALVARAPLAFFIGSLVLLLLTAIILASALQRLWLYVDSFGLSLLRLNALAFLCWMAGAMGVVSLRAMGKIDKLIPGLLAWGLVVSFGYAFIGPARLVAGVNMDRAIAENTLPDLWYLQTLGDDAMPVVLSRLSAFNNYNQCELMRGYFYPRIYTHRHQGWRGWNWSVSRANNIRALLETASAEAAGDNTQRADNDESLIAGLKQMCPPGDAYRGYIR